MERADDAPAPDTDSGGTTVGKEPAMQSILIATDGSQSAHEALHFAIDLARDAGADLHVLSVRPGTYHGHGGPVIPVTDVDEIHGSQLIAESAVKEARAPASRRWHTRPTGTRRPRSRTPPRSSTSISWSSARTAAVRLSAALFGSVSARARMHGKRPVTIVRTQPAPGARGGLSPRPGSRAPRQVAPKRTRRARVGAAGRGRRRSHGLSSSHVASQEDPEEAESTLPVTTPGCTAIAFPITGSCAIRARSTLSARAAARRRARTRPLAYASHNVRLCGLRLRIHSG